ncbi:MAG: hypothetical protein LBE74_04670 [Treponema sp.]|nr:hypothetical protein [Treponema sp.]
MKNSQVGGRVLARRSENRKSAAGCTTARTDSQTNAELLKIALVCGFIEVGVYSVKAATAAPKSEACSTGVIV